MTNASACWNTSAMAPAKTTGVTAAIHGTGGGMGGTGAWGAWRVRTGAVEQLVCEIHALKPGRFKNSAGEVVGDSFSGA